MLKTVMFVSLMLATGVASASGSSGNKKQPDFSSSNSSSSAKANVDVDVSAKGGSAKQHQDQYQDQYQEQQQKQVNNQSVDSSGNASTGDVSVNVDSSSRNRVAAASAFAPALTSSNDTCMGSSSAGAQGITFGLSFGTTWNDDNCVLRKDARFLHNIQRSAPALSLMCSKPSILKAIKMSGTRADKIACGLPVPALDEVGIEIDSRNKHYRDGESG